MEVPFSSSFFFNSLEIGLLEHVTSQTPESVHVLGKHAAPFFIGTKPINNLFLFLALQAFTLGL